MAKTDRMFAKFLSLSLIFPRVSVKEHKNQCLKPNQLSKYVLSKKVKLKFDGCVAATCVCVLGFLKRGFYNIFNPSLIKECDTLARQDFIQVTV